MVLPPVVLLEGGVVPVVGAELPAGIVPAGQGPTADGVFAVADPALPVAAPARLPAVAEPVFVPEAVLGLAAVPGPVPVVVAGTQVTGEMALGAPMFAPAWPDAAPGAGVVPP